MNKYLNRSNMPKQITSKQLRAYMLAKEKGYTANENYNKHTYGITNPLYSWIKVAISSSYGSFITKPEDIKLRTLNQWLKEGGHRFDDEGNLLSYLGKRYPFSIL